MNAPVRITFRPTRCYVFGRRVHHGPVALLWFLTDIKDWRVWVRDFLKRP